MSYRTTQVIYLIIGFRVVDNPFHFDKLGFFSIQRVEYNFILKMTPLNPSVPIESTWATRKGLNFPSHRQHRDSNRLYTMYIMDCFL